MSVSPQETTGSSTKFTEYLGGWGENRLRKALEKEAESSGSILALLTKPATKLSTVQQINQKAVELAGTNISEPIQVFRQAMAEGNEEFQLKNRVNTADALVMVASICHGVKNAPEIERLRFGLRIDGIMDRWTLAGSKPSLLSSAVANCIRRVATSQSLTKV